MIALWVVADEMTQSRNAGRFNAGDRHELVRTSTVVGQGTPHPVLITRAMGNHLPTQKARHDLTNGIWRPSCTATCQLPWNHRDNLVLNPW